MFTLKRRAFGELDSTLSISPFHLVWHGSLRTLASDFFYIIFFQIEEWTVPRVGVKGEREGRL